MPNDQIEGETDFAGWCQMVERCKCSERLQNEGESKLCVSARQIEEWMEWEQLCKMVPLLPPPSPLSPPMLVPIIPLHHNNPITLTMDLLGITHSI